MRLFRRTPAAGAITRTTLATCARCGRELHSLRDGTRTQDRRERRAIRTFSDSHDCAGDAR